MMKKLLLYILLFLSTNDSFAQSKVKVLDLESLLPIPDVVVSDKYKHIGKSNADGIITLTSTSDSLVFSHKNYLSYTYWLRNNNMDTITNIYLVKDYEPLEEFVFVGKKLELYEIFQRVKEKFAENYVASNIPLRYQHQLLIANNADTPVNIAFSVIWQGKQDKYCSYTSYYNLYNFAINTYNDTLLKNYLVKYIFDFNKTEKSYPNKLKKSNFQELAATRNIIKSTYELDGETYLDIIITPREPLKLSGLNFLTNNLINNKNINGSFRYLPVINYQINLSNYAIVAYRLLSIPITSDKIESLSNINNRNDLTSLLHTVEQEMVPCYRIEYTFQRLTSQANKYFMNRYIYKDQMYLMNYRLKEPPKYSITQEWNFIEEVNLPNWKEEWSQIYGYDYIYKELYQHSLSRNN